jgi:8-oxo-dGTP pyrophosphatase MutT (NUDIX family)
MIIRASGILLIDTQGKILALHRKPWVPESNTWGIAGGKIENNNPRQTAINKTYQETEIKLKEKDLSFLKKLKFKVDKNTIVFSAYTYKLNTIEPKIHLNTDGHDKYMWENPETLLQRNDLMTGMYPILKKYLISTT